MDILNIEYKTVIENFFDNIHEICFVYICDDIKSDRINRRPFAVFDKNELQNIDLRPEILKKIISNEVGQSNYIVNKNLNAL